MPAPWGGVVSAHTPGPWAVRDHWCDDDAFEVYPTKDGRMPTVGQWSAIVEVGDGTYEDEAEANAYLIAAAPDMLKALEYIEGMALANEPRDLKTIAQTARAAIAKATGAQA